MFQRIKQVLNFATTTNRTASVIQWKIPLNKTELQIALLGNLLVDFALAVNIRKFQENKEGLK
jgi:hypothetical protein